MEKTKNAPVIFTGIVSYPAFLTGEQGKEFMCQLRKVCCDKLPIFNSEKVEIQQEGDKIRMQPELLQEKVSDLTPEEAVSLSWTMAIRDILTGDVGIQEIVSR